MKAFGRMKFLSYARDFRQEVLALKILDSIFRVDSFKKTDSGIGLTSEEEQQQQVDDRFKKPEIRSTFVEAILELKLALKESVLFTLRESDLRPEIVHILSDASRDSKKIGLGMVVRQSSKKTVFWGFCKDLRRFPTFMQKMTIYQLESLAVLISILLSDSLPSGANIYVHTDNIGVLFGLLNQSSASPAALAIFTEIKRILKLKNLKITVFYVNTKRNPADLPSRNKQLEKVIQNIPTQKLSSPSTPESLAGLLQSVESLISKFEAANLKFPSNGISKPVFKFSKKTSFRRKVIKNAGKQFREEWMALASSALADPEVVGLCSEARVFSCPPYSLHLSWGGPYIQGSYSLSEWL